MATFSMLPDCSLPMDPVSPEKVLHGTWSRLPISTHMFSLCHGVDHAARGLEWEPSGAQAPNKMPSVGTLRLGSCSKFYGSQCRHASGSKAAKTHVTHLLPLGNGRAATLKTYSRTHGS